MIRIFLTALFLLSTLLSYGQTGAPFGLNLSGAEFGKNIPGVFNTDYGYPGVADLDYFKAKDLRMVRMPFKWERIQPELGGELDPVELGRMKKFVGEAAERDMLIILDMHNYGRRKIDGEEFLIGTQEVKIKHVADAWRKLAAEFKSYGNIWGYGIMNEPHDMLESTPWFDIAQGIIKGIRKSDKNTSIIVGGDSWSSAERWPQFSDNLKGLKDPSKNLIFEAHVYFDNDASGAYRKSYDEELATPNTGIERVAPFIKWLDENDCRGFLGEYGIPDDDPRWMVVLDNFLAHLQQNCINGTYWSAGPRWGKYKLAVTPRETKDRPQMKVLEKYKAAESCR